MPFTTAPDQMSTTRRTKPMMGLIGLLVLLILIATYFLCSVQYEAGTQKILVEQEGLMQNRTNGIARSVALWVEDIEAQAARISKSDSYDAFADEMQELDNNVLTSLNTLDAPAEASDDLTMLIEQLPFMREALLDFMNYSGMQDARLVDKDGVILFTALLRPLPISKTQLFAAEKALTTNTIAFAPVRDSLGGLMLDFADPVVPLVEAGTGTKSNVALVLSTSVAGNIAQFLTREQGHSEDIQSNFVQYNGTNWEMLTPNATSPIPFKLQLDLDTDETSIPFQKVVSVDGKEAVYLVGKKIESLNWWVLAQMPEATLNAKLQGIAWVVYGIGSLISLGIILLLASLWWMIVGREQRTIANRFQELYQVIKQQKHLLDCVNVSLDVGIFMTDGHGVLKVSNKAFAEIMRQEEAALLNTPLSTLFDPENGGTLLQTMRHVDDTETTESLELSLGTDEDTRLLRITLFPFVDTNVEGEHRGVVGTIQDITEFRRRSKQHQLQQQNTIRALVQAIEGVDSYLAGHSQLMEKIANIVAVKLELEEKDCNTIRIAAGLSQIGKLFVPRELLTKLQGLTDEEHALMMSIPDYGYQILQNIDFGLPVAEAVYAMYEKMDGTGYPRALKGADIAIHARVLAVVNAFCAMISPRSYRSGMPFDEAISLLRKDTNCDSDVLSALEAVLGTPECMALLQTKELERNVAKQ